MGGIPARLLLGTDEPVPAALTLRAGPLQVRLRGTRLLAMEAAGYELWHGAAFLYRDDGWVTPEPVADCTRIEQGDDGFTVRIDGHIPASQRIDLRIEISGSNDGSLTYDACATPSADLSANRIGVCVLHPPSTFGRRIDVTHVDGRTSASTLPTHVAPWPPFMMVRALRHEYTDGAWAWCRLEGDSFELEDQRNNADASFKTYSRSNMMPRPFTLFAGREIRQRLSFRLDGTAPSPLVPAAPAITVAEDGFAPMPAIGIGITPADAQNCAGDALADALRELAPSVLHLGLRSPDEPVHWAGVAKLLAAGGSRLRLDVEDLDATKAPTALGSLASAMRQAGVTPADVAVFPGTPAILAAARQAFPAASIGSGTPHYFAQLNRIEGLGPVDFLSFTVSSIVHGADDDAVMHGLQSLPWLLRTLAVKHPQVPVHTGPSAIASMRSPLGAQPQGDGVRRIALARHDPRTGAMFGAAWTLGHVASLAQAGARAISVLHLLGEQGVLIAGDDASLRRTPAFFVLQALAGATHLRRVETGAPDRIAALWGRRAGAGMLLLANLTDTPVDVRNSCMTMATTRILDPVAVDAGARQPWRDQRQIADQQQIHLPPWAVVHLVGVAIR
jgi:hypothetical protein